VISSPTYVFKSRLQEAFLAEVYTPMSLLNNKAVAVWNRGRNFEKCFQLPMLQKL